MDLNSICSVLNLKPETLLKQFNRTKDRLEKKGISISKIGRGANTDYFIKEWREGALAEYTNKQNYFQPIELETETWTTEEIARAFGISVPEARNKLILSTME